MKHWFRNFVGGALVLLWIGCDPTANNNLEWFTDLSQAQAKAKAENKRVFLDFTGSDWCPPCMQMKKEVFSKPAFAAYATNNLVLVEVDFPRNKKISEAQTKANEELAQKYNPEGLLPTFVLLDKNGQLLGKLEYLEGGPAVFIAEIEKLAKKN